MVFVVDDQRKDLDRENTSLLVLLDLSIPFDTIRHGILWECLFNLGLDRLVLCWFYYSHLDRSQKVVLGNSCSSPWPLAYGFLQGSILSSMLFNIYMKLLGVVKRVWL